MHIIRNVTTGWREAGTKFCMVEKTNFFTYLGLIVMGYIVNMGKMGNLDYF